jgi:hypothetical protein
MMSHKLQHAVRTGSQLNARRDMSIHMVAHMREEQPLVTEAQRAKTVACDLEGGQRGAWRRRCDMLSPNAFGKMTCRAMFSPHAL